MFTPVYRIVFRLILYKSIEQFDAYSFTIFKTCLQCCNFGWEG